AVPEALPAIVTGALTIGVQRMARRRAIVRRLPAVETLGSVTVICSDKTGTLTRNEMTVRRLWLAEQELEVTGVGYDAEGTVLLAGQPKGESPDLAMFARVSVLCNDAHLLSGQNERQSVLGDPTEGSLLVLAAKAGIAPEPVRLDYPRVNEIPFDAVRKRMTTIHRTPAGRGLACLKGAPEVILNRCSQYMKEGSPTPITPDIRRNILEHSETMAEQALRVLALAYRELDHHLVEMTEENVEADLIFVGLAGMVDPPRQEVKHAIAAANQAKVRTVMITGDHKLTALAVARELGWKQDSETALTGVDLDRISDEDLPLIAASVGVYARTSPEHKLRLVRALQENGQIVAMTGDGINDAPALRRADVGVAMGIAGTDVTKEAADIVLADDNFATIVAAVEEGRVIYDNIRKVIRYLLTTNSGELLTVFIAVLAGWPMPLLAIQILWVNLVTDGLPALALGVEPAEPGVMRRPPRPPGESIFARGLWQHVVWVGSLMAVGSLGVMYWGMANYSLDTTRTMVFLTLASFQMFHILAIRSERESLFKIGLFTNPYLLGAVLLTFALQMAITYVPFLQATFSTRPLNLLQLAVCLITSSTVFWGVEIEKWQLRRRSSR
ncbi:MAG: HAD-IC family P-type ATPase, partial [Dehalococcoidia bacterium]|nr:HAD-IC family P-type ATPase [Dehalococcoidia bacterium]